jgi:DNA-binding transcriptional LysR family regulator
MDFRADVTMLASAQADPRLHYVNFGSRPLVLYIRKGNALLNRRAVRLKELQGQKMITREAGSQTRLLFEQACAKANITPDQKLENNNRDAFCEAVAHGLGIGIIGDRGLVSDDRLQRINISGVNIRIDRQLACLKERKNARLIKSFLAAGRIIADHLD